ncbi:response regulator receiver protein [Nesterenkonia sp. AN1]|uniref:GAF domain-containing protein n=1 Tax=Nesterenkonia aurantiaca TaxID=1436010 RepID=A0A4R7G0U7_9MICC|nr:MULTISPECIES: GAF and ANTAR domain-containing protein [Nesterenkonia]EXF23908.1 response regulator receiver protein [Nesterenkonia sp. AN1]TDS84795.1 GAF domain-containing protein [Nesterenkonia aurantiaca]
METTKDPQDLTAALADVLTQNRDIAGMLTSIAELAARHLSTDREVLCGVLLNRAKRNTVLATSSLEAQQMDELQAGFDEGPCLEAQKTGNLIRVPDVRYENRWPEYMAEVRDRGLRSIVAVPVVMEGSSTAAMNFYTHEVGAFTEEEIRAARRFTEAVSTVVAIAVRIAAYAEDVEDRRRAMKTRSTIDTAVGIIMAQNRCSQDDAVTVLKAASNHRNIKLRALAEELVASVGP